MIDGSSQECINSRAWPISCIAVWNHAPPYSLAPQSWSELMIAEPTPPAPPPIPPTASGGVVGETARTSPVTTVIPRLAVSTKRTP